jgi:hypothetical protein
MIVCLREDDVDRHGTGCLCDSCNSQGKSYGVGIYPAGGGEVIERCYAASPEAALALAQRTCVVHGHQLAPADRVQIVTLRLALLVDNDAAAADWVNETLRGMTLTWDERSWLLDYSINANEMREVDLREPYEEGYALALHEQERKEG